MSADNQLIHVEVVYALPHEQRVFQLVVKQLVDLGGGVEWTKDTSHPGESDQVIL